MSDARGFGYGLLAGVGLMFLFDPRQGGARRAIVRDKSRRAVREVEEALDIGTRDLAHRIEGAIVSVLSPPHVDVPDDVLVARVRARLGHVCSHAHAIQVIAKGDGCIELKGPVIASERDRIVRAVSHVRGVRAIDDDLEVHATPGSHPSLQGAAHGTRGAMALWTPATRLALGLTSAGIALSSILRGSAGGVMLGGAAVLAIARSMTSRLPQRMHAAGVGVQPLREAYPPGSEWAPAADREAQREVRR